jgi:hypothetical protein
MNTRTLALLSISLASMSVFAQKGGRIERRDQAEGWYLPVMCSITANGGNTNQVHVVLYKDNVQVVELKPGKKSSFELDLDLDGFYTILVQKDGYREKTVYIDSHMPEQQVKYGAYQCFVNMEPLDKFAHSDPFYLDFPSAVVRWSDEKQAFTHSDGYLANIQLKMALLAAQIETQ